ncbi:phosphohistidine phosphatase SixA [Serratia rubidaea]|uniref:phosphohistidine phosphatase SixA n=1 Tax=Serratia rubidaea TaxID=61652 RepID=A0A3S4HXU3_SERRU|nr:phosphohistidine phosphatase SixA [Serratia rubidaea]MBD8452177.1 phosphohistidine phosphatase SixA [Serratia rubidaea]MBH1929396.1 phosphohistidine phosphatase SixA [Serratia rubidaea]MBS0975279.1 phosphohistidine phosphatase SixA [Serratia rubidaea]MDC6109931.1 phosphohistidine phosphatase SixA [Serratia rubidaea]MDC6118140.1 phosphohistidine phosphatase SixA [Serratia rubidaea]
MQVLIMRHGEAALDAASDAVRPLTLCGRDESRQMAAWLNTKSVDIERVLVSPYLRAEQTLETVRDALTLPKEAEVMAALTPGGDAALVVSYLQVLAQQGVESVLIVSHLPLVGYLVAELCPGECPLMFATSAIAYVELAQDGSAGKLEWQVSPSQLMAKV